LREKQKEKEMNNEISHSILNTNYPDIFIFKLQDSFLLLHHKKKEEEEENPIESKQDLIIFLLSLKQKHVFFIFTILI
jgi:hypothetical protein